MEDNRLSSQLKPHVMRKFITTLPLIFLLFCGAVSPPPKGFSGIKCGSDIPKALIGRYMPNERVVVTERRHKDIGLRDLGGIEVSDKLFSISWMICGDEYMLLEDKRSIVRDVLRIPEHSKRSPEVVGGDCQVNGIKLTEVIVAVLDNEEGKAYLPAKVAWKIDEKRAKFVSMPTSGLRCSRDSIITADGGQ